MKSLFFSFLFLLSSITTLKGAHPLSLEQKVGQMLMVHFNGKTANADAEYLINTLHVGGFIYYNWANKLETPTQVQQLSNSLQRLNNRTKTSLPLFIATDQEYGVVTRLTHGFTSFPGNSAIGLLNDLKLAESIGESIAEELLSVGININLAPVIDVNSNPLNPVIGIRSFSGNPAIVANLGGAYLKGYQTKGLIGVLKHFPGHGDVTMDSHEDLPILKKERGDLTKVELFPFCQLIDSADAIMTAHLIVPALDPSKCATLSSKILNDLLRKQMGFNGLIISDSMIMNGVIKNGETIENAVVEAILSGNEMLILGGLQLIGDRKGFELTIEDVTRIHQHLVNAVNQGIIPEEIIDQAVTKIVALKMKYKLSERILPTDQTITDNIKTKAHLELAKQAAERSVQVVKGESLLPLDFSMKNICMVFPELCKPYVEEILFTKNHSILFFEGLNPSEEQIEEMIKGIGNNDTLLFFSYNAWKNPMQKKLIEKLTTLNKSVVLIALRDPQDSDVLKEVTISLTTRSPSLSSIQAALDRL